MTLNEMQICLLKYKKHLAFLVAVAIVLCAVFIDITKTYTAEVFIKYTGTDANQGLTENGKQLDPHEISDAILIKRAMDAIDTDDITFAKVSRGLEIVPIIPTEEEEKHASWIENFSTYDQTDEKRQFPIYYSVKLTTDESPEIARNLVRSLVEQYCVYYVEQYASVGDIAGIYDDYVLDYDYFETAQILKEKISSNMEYLSNIANNDVNYRSVTNGYSMLDLHAMFKKLLETKLAGVSQKIIDEGISKDSIRLTTTLKNKAETEGLKSEEKAQNAASQRELMDVYSEKNKEYLWDVYESSKEEGNQVRTDTDRDKRHASKKTTYDQMMLDYVNFACESENFAIDKKYSEQYMTAFSGEDTVNGEVEAELKSVVDEYNKIYKMTEVAIQDYNEFKSGRYVCKVSGIVSGDNTPTVFYYTVSIALALSIGLAFIIASELKKKRKI